MSDRLEEIKARVEQAMTLTAVSLFAGVGGFDLAMQRNGIDVVATVEIDKAARGVLQHQFPKAKHFEDVTKVSADELRDAGFVPDRGIITGGFPCQDLSVAGKRAGLAGGRSGLFWEIVRLADELQPKYLVLENVPGLLSSNAGRDFGTVLGALVDLGYGVAYSILDAQHFGVPQRRRRVFIVGYLGDDGRTPCEILAITQSLSGDSATGAEAGQDVAKTLTRGSRNNIESEDFVLFGDGRRGHDSIGGGIVNTLEARMGTGGNNVPMLLTMREGKDGGGKGPLVSEDVSLTLATGNGQVLIQPFNKVVRSGARDEDGELPAEVWRSESVPPTLSQFDQGEVRATTLVAFSENVRSEVRETPIVQALSTGGGKPGQGYAAIRSDAAVRRLTPTECERLQGFPDGWTAVNGQKDSARYKQMGNAVAVPVVEWIMERLVNIDAVFSFEYCAERKEG
jgi:DNA (cytosine-5)-methyltransferase 1